jgi:hypothetical protein
MQINFNNHRRIIKSSLHNRNNQILVNNFSVIHHNNHKLDSIHNSNLTHKSNLHNNNPHNNSPHNNSLNSSNSIINSNLNHLTNSLKTIHHLLVKHWIVLKKLHNQIRIKILLISQIIPSKTNHNNSQHFKIHYFNVRILIEINFKSHSLNNNNSNKYFKIHLMNKSISDLPNHRIHNLQQWIRDYILLVE